MIPALMIWGTSSGAGKSLLVTALCRWAARHGIDVAPFKAQNMSNNARVVPGIAGAYREIGAAQYFQALAARVTPSVDMNPVLLKPERDTASQVVLHGTVAPTLSPMPWCERSVYLAAAARDSFARLRARHDLIVIEGAGSPAEINLAAHDYVNLDCARWAQAAGGVRSLIVTDIDRGGAFAHLYGTWALLPSDLKTTIAGFVLNRFRGDAALLAPGPEQLQQLTQVPIVGVLPMRRDHGLPEEDGMIDAIPPLAHNTKAGLRVAVIATPRISNLDEFAPLRKVPGLRLIWARTANELDGADWIILPGSKQVSGDLRWLRAQGIDLAIVRHAAGGGAVLGICGGLQMLGRSLADPMGFDGERFSDLPGLGLLPLTTRFEAAKTVRPRRAHFGAVNGPWLGLRGQLADGYEIHNGQTHWHSDRHACDSDCSAGNKCAVVHDERGEPIGWQSGSVLGVYSHGLFESPAVIHALFGATVTTLDDSFNGLADLVDEFIDPNVLRRLLLGE